MKNIINNLLLLMVLAFTLGACDHEDFLTAEYYDGLVDQTFLTDKVHVAPAVAGVYDVLSMNGTGIDRLWMGSTAADAVSQVTTSSDQYLLSRLDSYAWTATESGDDWLKFNWLHWTANYNGIERANLILEKIDAIDMPDAEKNQAKGEVHVLRAYFYYLLVTAYGDVPLITETLGYEDAANITRAPETEVWSQIISDLTTAVSLLPDAYADAADANRVTKGTANAILAQVYLWQKDWTKAEAAANAVITSPAGYALEPVYADLFNGVAENSNEMVFCAGRTAGIEGMSIWSDNTNETNFNIIYGPEQSWAHFYQPDSNFVRHNTYVEATDVRIDTMTLDGDFELYDINNDGELDVIGVDASSPHQIHIMKGLPVNVDLTSGQWSGLTAMVDLPLIRLAEVYLDYAEALVQQGNTAGALTYINRVRQRAGASDITATDQAALLDIILNERKVELCFEGKRFFDLKRAGKLQEVLGPIGWQSHQTVYPIPQEEIDLTMMTQNPGY